MNTDQSKENAPGVPLSSGVRPFASTRIARLTAFIGLSAAVSLSAQTTSSSSTAAKASDDTTEEVKLEKFEVTGSRIKRLDAETPAPVVNFSAAEIRQGGFTSLGDFVQSLPFNTGSSNSVVQTASFTRGAATVNPRGLGSNRFLVLINGRRSVGYALTNSNNQTVFDFNSIPIAAIDQISYLKDGASAIYGSDAVTGVMDIKLKKNFSGLQSDVLVGNTMGHDTFTKQASFLVGAQSGKTSIVFVGSYSGANDNFIKDYARSRSTDYSALAPKGINQNSSLNWPANLNLTAAQATAAGFTTGSGLYVLNGGQPTANPTKSQFTRVAAAPNANRYDFAQTYQLFPSYDYYGVYTNLRHEINDRLYVFGEIIYSNNRTDYSFTPSVIQSVQNPGTGPTGLLNVPATNPYNPFGFDITNFLYRTNFGQPRRFDTSSTASTYLLGIGGTLPNNWTWEAGASLASGEVNGVSRNQIRAADLQAALNGTTRQTALNPFGPSDNQDVVNRLFTVSNSVYAAKAQMFDFTVSGNLFELPGGDIGIAAGAEARKDIIDQAPDTASFVGSGGGTPYRGDREIFSGYVEATFPITRSIEAQLAARYEDYSDFGNTTKPKIGAKWKLPQTKWVDVLLRASFSQSFKAPDLGRLYTAATVAFSSTVRQDPKRPQDAPTQLRIITSGNSTLQPEEADAYYAGAVFDVKAVKGLSFAVDYFMFEINDVISSPSDTTLLAREDQFPGAVVRDTTQGNPGPILFIRRVPFNVAKQWYEGMDFEAKYEIRDTRLGRFQFTANATRTLSIKSNSGIRLANGNLPSDFENIGLYNNPKWNGTFGSAWAYKNYSAAARLNYIGSYYNDAYTLAGWGEKAVATVNTSFTYSGFWDTRVTVGVNNVFDREPPFNGYETTSYDQGTYGSIGLGRFVYLRLSRNF
jgi:outer membrane receptor protein involved in Fe transport